MYQRYVLSKLSWNLTIADIGITWVNQFLDIVFNQCVRSWLEIPIAGTVDIIQLSKRKFGIYYVMVSTRFTQYQTVIRNNPRKSSNNDVVRVYYDTNCVTPTCNTFNSNLPKKLLPNIEKTKKIK